MNRIFAPETDETGINKFEVTGRGCTAALRTRPNDNNNK